MINLQIGSNSDYQLFLDSTGTLKLIVCGHLEIMLLDGTLRPKFLVFCTFLLEIKTSDYAN